jgi:hypothetical protein
MGFLGDRLERRGLLMAALLLTIAGDGLAMAAPRPVCICRVALWLESPLGLCTFLTLRP